MCLLAAPVVPFQSRIFFFLTGRIFCHARGTLHASWEHICKPKLAGKMNEKNKKKREAFDGREKRTDVGDGVKTVLNSCLVQSKL
jgi:hypothetical protein